MASTMASTGETPQGTMLPYCSHAQALDDAWSQAGGTGEPLTRHFFPMYIVDNWDSVVDGQPGWELPVRQVFWLAMKGDGTICDLAGHGLGGWTRRRDLASSRIFWEKRSNSPWLDGAFFFEDEGLMCVREGTHVRVLQLVPEPVTESED